MLELEEAQRRILEVTTALGSESILLSEADGRVLSEKVVSEIDLPPFDNSAVDGYALQAQDLESATQDNLISLRLVGKIPAGESSAFKVNRRECVRIFTGSPLPDGADAVVMQEDTQRESASDRVFISCSAKPWENIRFRGEDVKVGSALAEPGVRLSPAHLSLFGATGKRSVRVSRQPVVALLATGSELREAGDAISGGEIFESNRIGLAALAKRSGAVPRVFPLVPDDLALTKAALQKAFAECDVVVTTGGVSVGELDFVKAAFEDLGGKLEFWKISIKPGKPFVFGRLGEKFLFGLPGNPVSALVTFVLLVAPALLRIQGAANPAPRRYPGVLAETFANPGSRRHFVRVSVDENGNVSSAGIQASHILSSLAKADGLVEVAPQTTLAMGTTVLVQPLD